MPGLALAPGTNNTGRITIISRHVGHPLTLGRALCQVLRFTSFTITPRSSTMTITLTLQKSKLRCGEVN